MCRSSAIPGISVRGWVGASSLPFLSAESANLVLLDRSKLFETLKVFLILFHIHFLETKAPKRHTIFNNSKLNINVYTSYTPPPPPPPPPAFMSRGVLVSVFPIFRSSFPMFVRLLVRSFAIPLITLSLSLSLS